MAFMAAPGRGGHDFEVVMLEELSAEEHAGYATAYAKLQRAFSDSLVEYLYSTLLDAEQLASSIAGAVLTTRRSLTVTEHERIRRRLLTSVLNFLSAVYMFEEHIKVKAIGENKDRKLRDEVKARFRNLCAVDPWVSLLLAVRHAAVHQTTAIISHSMRTEEASDGVISFCQPVVSREVLDGLKGVIEPGSTVEEFLNFHEQDPDLLVLMSDTFDSLEQFYRDVGGAPLILDTLNPASCWGSEMISSMARKNYTDEFRRQAVDLYESTPGATLRGIADDLGISRGTLADWVKTFGTGSTTAAISTPRTPTGRPETQAEKVARLEAEVAQLRAEKAKVETEKSILRQAAKYFAGETNW